MNKKDLIQARVATQTLLVKTIKQFGISLITLILCSMFASVFFPSIMNQIGFIVMVLFGMAFGIMIGAYRAYTIFWEKMEFESEKK